jgi:hypothetical protein
MPDALLGEESGERFHLRHLRHGPIMNARKSGA